MKEKFKMSGLFTLKNNHIMGNKTKDDICRYNFIIRIINFFNSNNKLKQLNQVYRKKSRIIKKTEN